MVPGAVEEFNVRGDGAVPVVRSLHLDEPADFISYPDLVWWELEVMSIILVVDLREQFKEKLCCRIVVHRLLRGVLWC